MNFPGRLLLIVALNLPAWSAVIFTNLGPGDSYSNLSYSVYSGQFVATEFMPSETGLLEHIRLPLHSNGLNGATADLLISLRVPGPDPNGAAIESWVLVPSEVSPSAPPPGNIEVLLSSLHPTLIAGNAYWLRVESVTFILESYGWPQNVIGASFGTAVSLDQGLTWATAGPDSAFEVNAVVSDAIPEPASGVLLGIGAAVVIAIREIRSRSSA
jgi:hypothetical protein